MVEYLNDIIHERNGWVKNSSGGYVKHQIITKETYYYSILKDPEAKENFQIYRGAMKKTAVDRMAYIMDHTIVRQKGESDQEFEGRLKLICHYKGGNTVIINGRVQTSSVKISGFGL